MKLGHEPSHQPSYGERLGPNTGSQEGTESFTETIETLDLCGPVLGDRIRSGELCDGSMKRTVRIVEHC